MADWAEAYGLLDRSGMVRQIVWIGPNGKILAKDLHGKDIKATVAQALAVNPDPKGTSTPPLVPPSGKTNIGEKPPAAPNQVNAASGPVNSTKPAANPSGVALEIRCTTNVFKVGDEIPIEFILSNHGTKDYTTKDSVDGAFVRFNLVVKTNFGENIYRGRRMLMDGFNPVGMLHPGESFSKIVALNHWAVIREPGRYEVAVTYVGNSDTNQTMAPVNANPVTITVSPRTREEMHNYIEALTNQVAARLEKRVSKQGGPADAVMDELVLKLTYTCSPEIVPTLLGLHYDTGPRSGNESAWEGQALQTALLNYVPKTEETWQAILQAVFRHGLDWTLTSLLESYKFHNEELKPIIERALAADNPGQWNCGAMLAGDTYYDDSFTDRLIAIATDTNTLGNTRAAKQSRLAARDALARNRTDAGVKTLKMLLNDPAPENWAPLGANILIGYWETNRMGKRLHPEDFEANELRPLNERLLASTNFLDNDVGLSLALHFGDDALTPKLIALATKPGFKLRERAVWALAYNRTDESVKTLKTLLSDPDPKISKLAEEAIRYAYNSRGDARGRPLRADDFDAKFREPEVTPAK
jgi:hypothetical protein